MGRARERVALAREALASLEELPLPGPRAAVASLLGAPPDR